MKKQTAQATADDKWTYESRDQMSALIEKLRALPRVALADHDYVLAVDLDAAITASIQAPDPKEAA